MKVGRKAATFCIIMLPMHRENKQANRIFLLVSGVNSFSSSCCNTFSVFASIYASLNPWLLLRSPLLLVEVSSQLVTRYSDYADYPFCSMKPGWISSSMPPPPLSDCVTSLLSCSLLAYNSCSAAIDPKFLNVVPLLIS